MNAIESSTAARIGRDLTAGIVVFLVALPLCMGIALASDASVFSGLVSGVVGGIVIGSLSGSHTSVSGPAAGLTAVVAAQIAALGSFEAFLLAVVIAGLLQIGLGLLRIGSMQAFVPGSVIKGLLAAIGIILILKQIPHLVGHDDDLEGDLAFLQPDDETTFSALWSALGDFHLEAGLVGLVSLGFLFAWDRIPWCKKSGWPPQLLVVLLGIGLSQALRGLGEAWVTAPQHLVQVPIADSLDTFRTFFLFPAWSRLVDPAVALAGVTIALVASLETLLNVEAADKLDPRRRSTPANRELIAQGAGNLVCGLIGGLPVTSVIVRSSVNINAGSQSRLSAIVHGILLALCVALVPTWLNLIPLACLAAILIHTGFKLASPQVIRRQWQAGFSQFVPFLVTVTAIVFTDLLIGVVIGILVSAGFILYAGTLHPLKTIRESREGRETLRIELAHQMTFLNRAALSHAFDRIAPGSDVTIDARQTDYIDPDVLELIRDFESSIVPARKIHLDLVGLRDRYPLGGTAAAEEADLGWKAESPASGSGPASRGG